MNILRLDSVRNFGNLGISAILAFLEESQMCWSRTASFRYKTNFVRCLQNKHTRNKDYAQPARNVPELHHVQRGLGRLQPLIRRLLPKNKSVQLFPS